jgi:hypothetical protein
MDNKGKAKFMVEDTDVDQFSKNYREMNDIGKKKLVQVSEQFFKIWNTVHEGKTPRVEKDESQEMKNSTVL